MTRWPARACLVLCMLLPVATRAVDYRIDSARSHADFSIRLLWLKRIDGTFEHIDGEVTLNRSRDEAQVEARITVASIQMPQERFRRWLQEPEFFDAQRYPMIYFRSEPIPLAMLHSGGRLNGTLTMRGVSRSVRFDVVPTDCPLASDQTCLISLSGSLQRSDFGMTGHRTTLSDRVDMGLQVALHVEAR